MECYLEAVADAAFFAPSTVSAVMLGGNGGNPNTIAYSIPLHNVPSFFDLTFL